MSHEPAANEGISSNKTTPHTPENGGQRKDESEELTIPLLSSRSFDSLSDEERSNLALQSLSLAEKEFSSLSE
jgi:hypothetical protein